MKKFAIVLLSIMMIIGSVAGTVIVPIGGVQLAGAEDPTPTPQWVYQSTYSGQPVSYWQYTMIGQETLPSGTDNGSTLGGSCDKIEIRVYSDAECTIPMEPNRTATVSVKLKSPMYDWRHVDDRQMRQQYSAASASMVGNVTNWLYYRLYTPSSFGAPYALDESWTFTKQLDSSNNLGDKTTSGITAAVASETESVIVPAGTFTCYKLTITESSKTIIEYWDASGAFPYAPVKVVDSVSFGSTDTRVLYSSSSTLTPTPTPTLTPTPIPTLTPTPSSLAKIAYSHDAPSGNAEIYVMNADGSNQTRLTYSPQNDYEPHFSPDTTKIVFASHRSGQWDIYVMNVDGSNQTQITYTSGTDAQPSWSPTGSKIAFFSDRDGNSEIYVMNADGSDQTRLTNSPAIDCHPEWSPDGSMIVFVSDRDGNSEIYVMNADGSRQTRLTTSSAADRDPCWSPDGTKIAFASERDGNSEIYVMNADGSSQTRLTSDSAYADYQPSWSPDGNKIAFESDTGGATYENIYVIDANGQNRVQLTYGTDWSFCPSWSPATTPTPDYWDIPYKIVGFQTSLRYSLNGGTPTDTSINKQGVESGSLTIRFSKDVINGQRQVIIPASDFHLDTYSMNAVVAVFFNTLLTSDATGTLYTQDNIGDVDVFSESSASTTPQQTNTIGDGTRDPAGSLFINMPLKSSCDVNYMGIHAETSYNFVSTTGHSYNHVTRPGKGINNSIMQGNGMPCTQSGGPAPYVATPLTIVATGTGDGLNMNVYGYNVDSQVKMVFQLVPVSTPEIPPVVTCGWVTPDDADGVYSALTQTQSDTVQIYAVVANGISSSVFADLSSFGLGEVPLAAYMPGNSEAQVSALLDAQANGLVQSNGYSEQQITEMLGSGEGQLYTSTASIASADAGVHNLYVKAKKVIADVGQTLSEILIAVAYAKTNDQATITISPLEITPQMTTYYSGDELTAKFVITNTGTETVTLDHLLVGGRFNDRKLADGTFPDFIDHPVTLSPNVPYHYEGTMTLTTPGKYHFFCAYHSPAVIENENQDQNKWNCNINVVGADGQIITDWNTAKQYREKDITVSGDTAPSAIGDLTLKESTSNSVTLCWTAPGDDGNVGTASSYDIRYSTSEITEANWESVTQAQGEPVPQPAGSRENYTISGLAPSTGYYFGVKAYDDVGPSALAKTDTAWCTFPAVGSDAPYIHQVWDTKFALSTIRFNGKWACGPTSTVMLLAYLGRIESWPQECLGAYNQIEKLWKDDKKAYIYLWCDDKADLSVTDKAGNRIPNAIITSVNLYQDTSVLKVGVPTVVYTEYKITVKPKAGATINDVYSLKVWENGSVTVLADNRLLSEAPSEGYSYMSSGESPLHISQYGQFICKEYTYAGETFGDEQSEVQLDPLGKPTAGAYGYVVDYNDDYELVAWAYRIEDFLDKHGIQSKFEDKPTESNVTGELDKGHPVIASIKPFEGYPGHVVLITSYRKISSNPDKYIYVVNDPWGDANRVDSYYEWGTSNRGYGEDVEYTWETMGTGSRWVIVATSYKNLENSDPPTPTEMGQFNLDCTPIEVGTGIASPKVTFAATVGVYPDTCSREMDSVRLEIELRRLDEYVDEYGSYFGYFTGQPTDVSDFVPWSATGTQVSINVSGLTPGKYHWRARVVDIRGAASDWASYGDNPDGWADFEDRGACIANMCPTDIIVTDPDGLSISKITNEIPGAVYYEVDINGDGELDDIVTIRDVKAGEYRITVIPEAGAQPTDTYTIEISMGGTSIILAQDALIGEIPDQPYAVQSTETGVDAFPIADAVGPYQGAEGSPITLDASGSYDPDGNISLYEWDINNDGVYELSSTLPTAIYTWPDDYTGNVSLRVTDDDGLSSIDTAAATISNVPPTVEAGPNQSAECCVTNVSFSGSFTDIGALDTHTIVWNFGDGRNASGTLTPLHKYCATGNYTVTLTVTDDDGGVGTDTMTVNLVDTLSPQVNIVSPVNGQTYINADGSIAISYTATDLCDPAVTVVVAFDGIVITAGSIDPLNLSSGEHTLNVTATDDSGNIGTASSTFTVTPQISAWGRTWGFLEWYTNGHPTSPSDFFGSYSYPLVTANESIYSWIGANDSIYWRHTGYKSLPVPWEQTQLYKVKVSHAGVSLTNLSIIWRGHGGNGDLIYHTKLKVWNYRTSSWCTLVDVTSPTSKTFKTYVCNLTANASDYIEAGTGNVSILITADDDGRGSTENTEGVFTDYLAVTYTR